MSHGLTVTDEVLAVESLGAKLQWIKSHWEWYFNSESDKIGNHQAITNLHGELNNLLREEKDPKSRKIEFREVQKRKLKIKNAIFRWTFCGDNYSFYNYCSRWTSLLIYPEEKKINVLLNSCVVNFLYKSCILIEP